MTDKDYERFKEFEAWQRNQPHYRGNTVNEMGVVERIDEKKPIVNDSIVIKKQWVWLAAGCGVILTILALPYTLMGILIGIFGCQYFKKK